MGIEPTNDGYEPPAFTILAILIVCCWCLFFWKCSGLALQDSDGFGYKAWRQKSYSTASRYILQDAVVYHHKGTFTLHRPT